jgi:hypothetical protein
LSWCDKLASTPAFGLRFSPHHQSGDSIVQAISPILDACAKPHQQGFNIERHDSFGFQFSTNDGFQYSFDSRRMFVEFKHRMHVKPQSGGPPTAELLSTPRPYTDLLPDVVTRTLEAFSLLTSGRSRPLERIGIVSTTFVAENEVPPGIARLISYVAKPWGTDLPHYQIMIGATIRKTDDYEDRCIHSLVKSEDPDQLLTIKFDWQRFFSTPKPALVDSLKKQADVAARDALDYFEVLAEGSIFDERIISTAN